MSIELFGENRPIIGEDFASHRLSVPFKDIAADMNRVSSKLIINASATDLFVRAPSGEMALAAKSQTKYALDFVLALFGVIFLLPLFVITAALIMIDSRGNPLFTQSRTGLGGKKFKIWKFRTMSVRECGLNMTQAQRNDSRVTRVGKFLRKSSIDELPQLFNVLRGEMSLIGPRPHALAHDIHFGTLINEYCERFRVRPGITGLAQISGARGPTPSISIMAARVKFDLEYVEKWSLLLDAKILLKTLFSFAKHDAF